MAIRIIVDSSADMEEGYARAHDITIIPMTIAFGSEQYAEGVDLSREEFFERLVETDELPRTSQIPPMAFQDLFQEAVDAGDEVVCITLSSHISGTYQSACMGGALVVSRNPGKATVKHGYAKLGIHSHQELLDLVEG